MAIAPAAKCQVLRRLHLGMPLDVSKIRFERDSLVMLSILRAIDKRNHTAMCLISEVLNGLGIAAELLKVTRLKLDPLQWVMIKPLTEGCAGRYVLEPQIDMCRTLGYAARPKPVHKNPKSVTWLGWLVRAF